MKSFPICNEHVQCTCTTVFVYMYRYICLYCTDLDDDYIKAPYLPTLYITCR